MSGKKISRQEIINNIKREQLAQKAMRLATETANIHSLKNVIICYQNSLRSYLSDLNEMKQAMMGIAMDDDRTHKLKKDIEDIIDQIEIKLSVTMMGDICSEYEDFVDSLSGFLKIIPSRIRAIAKEYDKAIKRQNKMKGYGEIVDRKIAFSRFSDHPELLDYVANLTAGQPLISQMMANEIVNYLNDHKQNMVDPQTIKYAENQIINSSDFRVAFLSSLSSENENNSDWDESDVKMICHLITAATLKNEELTEEQLLEKLTPQQNKVYQELKRRSIILMDVDTHNLSVLVPLFGKWCHYWKEKTVALKGATAKE